MSANSSFAHLHVHSEYSTLDGASRIDELVEAAAADGQPALALTDHGNMSGVVDFYKACDSNGVKPIIGFEAYMAKEHRDERPQKRGRDDDSGGETDQGDKMYYHLTLLAENNEGYKNLVKLSSRAFMEGYYRKPRCDWDLLSQHSEGIIATSGCLGGQVLQALLKGRPADALAIAGRFQDIFGKDNFFIEVQDHGIPEQKRTMDALINIASKIDAPLIATNDSHYSHQGDAHNHEILLCCQTKSLLSDPNRFKFQSDQHYLKSAEEMRYLFREIPTACDSTLLVAERADIKLDLGQPHLPVFPVPEGFVGDVDAFLTELVFQGAEKRWPNMSDEMVGRLAFELRTIIDMGFSSYFLIMWDIVSHARKVGIRTGAGRGSAAGCAVSYCLGITQLDPIKYDLLFERFLNPSRVSLPDIDLDMEAGGREEMIRYTSQRFGEDHVAQVITFSKIKARAAVRDSARVLGYPFIVGDKISKALPPAIMGRDAPLSACLELEEEHEASFTQASKFRDIYASDPDARKIIDAAKGLEGLIRSDSIHAAAVVISDIPLMDIVPLQRKGLDAPIVTQYDMHGVEALGLLKMDFLGLRNLDVISECLRLIEKQGHEALDMESIALDDQKAFDVLRRGETIGVFQLESKAMRELVVRLSPTSFDHIAALVALYRPGPMAANMHNDYADRKNLRQPVAYFHDDARPILEDTQGLCIFQEQIMQVAQKFAGYSLAEADNLRKAMGKKIKEKMAAEHDKFVDGCIALGYQSSFAESLFDMVAGFAQYAFNRSHAYGYAMTAYQTAYLKGNFPTFYMAALCKGIALEKASIYLAEARRMGIKVELPSVNRSEVSFSATDDEIRVGLSSIAQVGEAFGEEVVAEREAAGKFKDMYDFVLRMMIRGSMNRRVFIPLVEAGALDEFGFSRLGLIGVVDEILSSARREKTDRENGMMSLFGSDFSRSFDIPTSEYTERQRLSLEKKVMGVYVSGHPMDGMEKWASDNSDVGLVDMPELEEGSSVWVVGLVGDFDVRTTRGGAEMAHFSVSNHEASVNIIAFPRTWQNVSSLIESDSIVRLKVRPSTGSHSERDYILTDIELMPGQNESSVFTGETKFKIRLPDGFYNDTMRISKLKGLLLSNRGNVNVELHVGGSSIVALPDDYNIEESPELVNKLKSLCMEAK